MTADMRVIIEIIMVLVLSYLSFAIERQRRDTGKIEKNTNGRLHHNIEELEAARNTIVGLRTLLREREDRLSYVTARAPDAEKLLSDYLMQREGRQTIIRETAAAATERRLIADEN